MPSTACKDFPVALTEEKIDRSMLSQYPMGLLHQTGNRRLTTTKFVQMLFAEKFYTGHYITLMLYVDLGLKVTKKHRVLWFKQEKKVGALHQLEHQNANTVIEQLRRVLF